MIRSFCLTAASLFASVLSAATFTNPIFGGADPWITRDGDTFYYSEGCEKASICIKSAHTLEELRSAQHKVVWTAPDTGPNNSDVWAPEIHKVDGKWYIYYAADPNHNNTLHRIFVIAAVTPDPLGGYEMGNTGLPNGQLADSFNTWGIDPDVFTAADGKSYLVWSCWHLEDPRHPQTTCLARLRDPLHVEGNTSRISEPREAWETRGAPIQEGPVGFTHNGHTMITYSGSASWQPVYSVGLLVHNDGDMLNPASWVKEGPIFDRHDTAYGPGSVVFFQSREGEWWNLYHGIQSLTCPNSWGCRNIRMQPMTWAANGTPLLGYPYDPGVEVSEPSTLPQETPLWGPAFGDRAEGNANAGQVVGEWAGRTTASIEDLTLGARWVQTFLQRNPNEENYSFGLDLQLVKTGDTSQTPRYGVYAAYSDIRNFLSVWIDPTAKTLSTYGTLEGALIPWAACPLPRSFNPRRAHLDVQKVADTLKLSVDGAPVTGPCTARKYSFLNGQIGLVAEDARVRFLNLTVR